VIRDERNVIPISLAVLLHVVVFGSLVFALDLSSRVKPITPMAIKGTLVTEMARVPPVQKQPEPEPVVEQQPEPEPEVEPEPPQPDPEELARKQAEEAKRLEDARIASRTRRPKRNARRRRLRSSAVPPRPRKSAKLKKRPRKNGSESRPRKSGKRIFAASARRTNA
jgi:outer membrane biosynthesis protein TonB